VVDQGAIEGDEPHVLDLALCEQQPVEGVAGRRLSVELGEDVPVIDREDGNAGIVQRLR
jgi:hypothetical protein